MMERSMAGKHRHLFEYSGKNLESETKKGAKINYLSLEQRHCFDGENQLTMTID